MFLFFFFFFFFNDTATTEIYTLSLHDALPISLCHRSRRHPSRGGAGGAALSRHRAAARLPVPGCARRGNRRRRGHDARHRGAQALQADRRADPAIAVLAAARAHPARAAAPYSEGAGRGRRKIGGDRRAARGDREGGDAAGGQGPGHQGAQAARAHARSRRRIRHDPLLSGLAHRSAMVEARCRQHRHRRGAPHPRRGPLRVAQDQAAHPRISGSAQAQARRQEPDPLLRRATRRGQDLARAEHRARDRPQVRSVEPRRRARRSGNPRASAHLYRRAARQHHPVDPQGRNAQPGDDARRGRQARRRLPRRSVLGAARSLGPRAELDLPGYTEDEKLEIARRYLLKRQLDANGLTAEQCEITEDAIRTIIRDYTREAGVRNLERLIGAVCRHVAMRVAEGGVERMRVDAAALPPILGPRRFENEVAMRTSVPGVATGLAWTPTGGDILFIEATRVPGSGRLILTGQLGEVMKESAQAALTLTKARAADLGFDVALFEKSDVHIHVPAGAIPKDGPSAGVAMFVALVSLLTGRTARNDVAMTGEISLRGLVLPIGGVKEKVLAAARAGITTVLLPARNQKDLEDVPEAARQQVRFVWLERVDDAVAAALNPAGAREEADTSVRGETSPGRRAARSM